jgi:hypothetical protein
MPITIATTFWKCPVCKKETTVDGTELAAIGTPFCPICEEQEMGPMDNPIPSVLYVDNGIVRNFVGVALRPPQLSANRFKVKIAKLWQEFISTPQPLSSFGQWLEKEQGILFLKCDLLDVNVADTD